MRSEKLKKIRSVKIIAFFLLLTYNICFSQEFRFAWITDTHIGTPSADEILSSIAKQINKNPKLKFVVHTGDITEKGLTSELRIAKNILNEMKIKTYVVPGNHDLKWSETGGKSYFDIFGDDKFYFEYENIAFIGINSGIIWKGGGGHITPETIEWLKKILSLNKEKEILLFVHHPLNDIDNGYVISNLLADRKIIAALVGHGHKNQLSEFNGLQQAMSRSTLSYDKTIKKEKGYGFTIVEINADSIKFFECDSTNSLKFWGGFNRVFKNKIAVVDSLSFINYSAKIIWEKDLNSTIVAHPIAYKNNLYVASYQGIIYGFDSYGNKLLEFDSGGKVVSSPGGADEYVVVGNLDGDLYTVNYETGMPQQTMSVGEPLTSGIISFKYQGSVELMIPSPTNMAIAVGTSYGKMLCYDLHSFQPLWENSNAKGLIETTPTFLNNRIIYGSWDNYLYMIDARNGLMIWRWTENKNFYYSPAVCKPISDGKFIYIATPDNFISAIDFNLARTVWRNNEYLAYESIGMDAKKETLLIKSKENKFFYVNSKNGSIKKEVDINQGLDVNPNIPIEYNGEVIFGSQNGIVYSINKNYKVEKLFFMGNARILNIAQLFEGVFAAVNMDGKIVVFSLK